MATRMETALVDSLRSRWHDTIAPFGAHPAAREAALTDLQRLYADNGRHYHTLEHIAAVLQSLAELDDGNAALQLAAWYHDAIYDSRATDNEERSAELAGIALTTLGIAESLRYEVARLILLTKTHQAANDDSAGQRLLDADLAILGALPDDYDRYAAAIRREYAWVPESAYRNGRWRILQAFLDRPRLFFQLSRLEEPARANLRREIRNLREDQ